jgi:prepilin-type N-terminal cleavage/methylation domain-containing protein
MRRGFSLTELAVALAIVGIVTAITLPRVSSLLDRLAVERAATQVTTALAVARNAAVMTATHARLLIAADSLRIDRWDGGEWAALKRWAGPEEGGVAAVISNPVVEFGPLGVGWSAANTRVVLTRGLQSATITTSRLGRVKRW